MNTPFHLGSWQVRPELGRISGPAGDVHLPPKAMQVLVCLARRAPGVVTKEDLFRAVWDGAFVSEGVLTYVISELRGTLGDDARNPCFIETIPKIGYRLIALPRFEDEPVTNEPRGRDRKVRLLASAIGLVVVLGVATCFWARQDRKPAVPFAERDWVLMTPFENRTGVTTFDGSLEHALEEELARSGLIRVASRTRIEETLRLMRKPPDTELDVSLAREVALRDGALEAIVTGRVEQHTSGHLVSVRMIDPASGATVSSRRAIGETEDDVLQSFRGFSDWVRRVLDEDLPAPLKPTLQRVTTHSLEALELYSQATAFVEEGKWLPAMELFERAVEEDPEFASAHIWLAHSYSNLGKGEPGPQYEKAFALADGLPDRERYFIVGSYYSRHLLDDERAVPAFEILTRVSPDDYWGARKLANAYHRLERYPEATAYRLRAADLRPGNFWDNASAVFYLRSYGGGGANGTRFFQRALGLATAEIAGEFPSEVADLELVPAEEFWHRGDLPRALEEIERVDGLTGALGSAVEPYLIEYVGRAYLTLGMIRAAERRFRAVPDPGRRNYLMAQVSLARGDETSFGDYVSQVDIASQIVNHWLDASALVVSGQTGILSPARAERVTGVLETMQRSSLSDPLRDMARDFSTVSRGELALARGNVEEALLLLQQGMEHLRLRPGPVFFLTAESLASAWEQHKDPEKAVQVLEEAASNKKRAFDDGLFRMRVQLRLAEIHRTLRRPERAREVESELRRLLVYADTDHAILGALEKLSRTAESALRPRVSLERANRHRPPGES